MSPKDRKLAIAVAAKPEELTDAGIDARMSKVLGLARRLDAMSSAIASLERSAKDIIESASLLEVSLGRNLMRASASSVAGAAKILRRERGNVRRALTRMKVSS